jgi:hypothetical protein
MRIYRKILGRKVNSWWDVGHKLYNFQVLCIKVAD